MKVAIGITGQMGTGKTCLVNAFAAYLRQRDVPVRIVSVDDIRRNILMVSPQHLALRRQLSAHFGVPLHNDGFDLQAFAAAVFGREQGADDFWKMAGPAIILATRDRMAGDGVSLLEWARLVQDGFLPLVDRVIITDCDAEVQRQRLAGGDLPPEQVQKRLSLQMDAERTAMALSTWGMKYQIVDTSGCPTAESYTRLCEEALHDAA
jgi:dephospho-CoA kinase